MATYWNSDDADTMVVLEPQGARKSEDAVLERKADFTPKGATVLTRRRRPAASWIDVAPDC